MKSRFEEIETAVVCTSSIM